MEAYNLSQYLQDGSELGYGDYLVGHAKCINVLLVGRSQAGKSTIVQTLLYPQKGTSSTGFSDTRDPACKSLFLTGKLTKESYQLNIIDTPGLKEVRENEESRTDDELLKLASKCVEEHITSLNVVCFVSRAGDTHRLDIEVFQKVKECLGDKYSHISMLVLTHCDEYSDNTLNEFEQNIRSHEISKSYFKYCQLGIVRFGAIDLKKLESFEEDVRPHVVQSKLKNIEKMRNNFIEKIISCADKGLRVSELQQIYEESKRVQQKAIEEEFKKRYNRFSVVQKTISEGVKRASSEGCIIQ